ncbi:MAG: MSHA biogenesis protein MshQ [Sulfitobacter sp.]|jgi:MSHA biogenesis protein MshQ
MPKILVKLLLLASLVLLTSNVMAVTVSVRVEADNDDAEQRISDGEMYRDSTDLELGFDDFVGGLQIVGMRFRNVAIPQGAIINSAYLEFETDEAESGATSLVIFGENVDSANEFSTSDDDISDRPKTSASANWSPSSWSSVDELHQTPDVASIIKEIVDRSGWSSGNDLVIMIEPDSTCTDSNCRRTAEAHEGESSNAPLLVINYSGGASSPGLQCRATFTDGLTNSDSGGKIKFENSAQLLNNPDTILGTSQIDNNGSVSSCDSANCSASNVIVSQLTSSYIGYSSATNLQVNGNTQTISANDYKDVTVSSGGSLFMSASFSSYHFRKLKVESNSFIYLTAGDYFLEEIEIKGTSQLIVQGAGTARIYVKNLAKFKESSVINGGQSGDPSKLVVYFFAEDEDKIKVETAASVAGYIYSEAKVEIKSNNSSVLGAVSSEGELKLKNDSSVTYDDSIDDTDFGDMCAASSPPAPLAEYRFDQFSWDGTPSEVIDSSGNNHNGTAVGGITTANGKICFAADIPSNSSASIFEAVDTGVDLDSTIGSSGTISLWYKNNSAWGTGPDKRLFSANDGSKYFFAEVESDGRVKFWFEDGGDDDYQKSTVSAFTVAAGVWKHLTFVWDVTSSTVRIFVDGVDQSLSGEDGGTTAFSSYDTLYFGDDRHATYSTGESSADGLIDEALLFDSALTAAQIQAIYTNQDAGNNYDGTTRSCPTSACDTGTLTAVGIEIGSSGSDSQINTTTEALSIHAAWLVAGSPTTGLIDSGTYDVTASGSSTVDRVDFGGSDGDFTGTLSYPGAGAGVGGDDFLVHTSGSISLPAGNYTIYVNSDDGFSFVMDTVSGDDVSFTKFGDSTSGASNELRFENTTGSSDTGGSFVLGQDSVFEVAAIFFNRAGSDYIEIFIANDILTSAAPAGYEVLRDGALSDKVSFGQCVASSQIDHYEIIHDGQGLTCDAESVAVKACIDTSCSILSTESVTLDFLADSTVVSSSTFTGSAAVSLNNTTVETLTLSVANPSVAAANVLVCDDGSGTSCDIEFTDAGFRFLSGAGNSTTLPNQTSGTVFGDTLKLQAVKSTDGVCSGLFTGNTDVDLSQENVDPGGTSGLSFSIDGNNIAKHSSVTATTLNFGADSIATIPTPLYHDAGQIRLRANYDLGGVTLSGSSNTFWVGPAQLVASAMLGATALNGASATATPTHEAGENFVLSVTAVNSLGVVTPNYVPGQIQLKLVRTGPIATGSVDGNVNYAASSAMATSISSSASFQSVALTSFSSGVSTYNAAHYSEVGLLSLEVQDSNYGNASIVIPSTPLNIGRFIPEHFKQTVAQDGFFRTTCGPRTMFSAYSGQRDEATGSAGAISYLTSPILAITAYNKQDQITQNYYEDSNGSVNDYMKLTSAGISITVPTLDEVATGLDTNKLPITASMNTGTLSQNDLTALPSVVALSKGVLHYQLSANDNFFYNRSSNALVAPFTSNIDFSTASIIDADSVNATTTTNASPTGVNILFGRLRLENSFGPETTNFPQPMRTEHFDGAGFIATVSNSCTSYDASKISLTNISLDPALTNVLGTTGNFVLGKTQDIALEAPGSGNQGAIGVSYDAYNWLEYDWDSDGAHDDNPSALATFGIFRGDDRVIYWREIYN